MMDSHDLGRDRGGIEAALRSIRQPVMLVSVSSDGLYPPSDQDKLHVSGQVGARCEHGFFVFVWDSIIYLGCDLAWYFFQAYIPDSQLVTLISDDGHDGFLLGQVRMWDTIHFRVDCQVKGIRFSLNAVVCHCSGCHYATCPRLPASWCWPRHHGGR